MIVLYSSSLRYASSMRLMLRRLNIGQMEEKSEFQYETSCHTLEVRVRDRVRVRVRIRVRVRVRVWVRVRVRARVRVS